MVVLVVGVWGPEQMGLVTPAVLGCLQGQAEWMRQPV